MTTYYRRCPECNGMGSISVMDRNGREVEEQCRHCHLLGGFVEAEGVLTRAEWEASIRRGDLNTLANIAQAMQREVYITICTNHSGGPASPHNEDCFMSVAVVGEVER